MERMQYDKQRSVQEAVAVANGETVQLQGMIQALRDEMVAREIRHGEEMQKLRQSARETEQQMKGTIVALREQWEKQNGR
jgi:hypothetical protein